MNFIWDEESSTPLQAGMITMECPGCNGDMISEDGYHWECPICEDRIEM